MRTLSAPAIGIEIMAPVATTSKASPNVWLRPRNASIAGIRETQVARSVPFTKNSRRDGATRGYGTFLQNLNWFCLYFF